MGISPGLVAFKLSFQLSPIILTGGTYTIATPVYFYTNTVMTGMRDTSNNASAQAQNTYQLDFEQPLLTLQDAQAAQNNLMAQLTAVAVGLGAAVAKSVLAFEVIKWIGVVYLVYLAVRQWRTSSGDLGEQLSVAVGGGRLGLVGRGFLVNATNPKGLVFLLAVLPQFVVPTAPLLPQYLTIGLTMVVVDVLVMAAYTGMAARLLGWLRTPRQQTVLNRTMSGLFATAAVVLSLVRRGSPT